MKHLVSSPNYPEFPASPSLLNSFASSAAVCSVPGAVPRTVSAMTDQEREEDVWAKATKAVDDLYELRDTYFPPNPDDKVSRLHRESDLALKLLDCIPPEKRKLPMERGMYEYLRGKILDVVPDYKKEAEDHLSKAVKLNPSLADAWLCLGNSIWKKGDLPSANNCFTLALSKGPNKKILCQLSMLERKMAQGAENQAEIVEESIKHAKEAITLDVKDGNSWYILGNASLTSFFVTGAWDHSKLLQSLKAYRNAEKDERMKSNPDLYFNCATVNKYLENYESSLNGFEAAASKDPSLNAAEEVQKMVNLLDKLDNMLKGHVRAKRLASLAASLGAIDLNPSYNRATVDMLSEGLNKAVAILGKVLFFVKHENATPLYFLVCDSNQNCFVLSVYGLQNDAVRDLLPCPPPAGAYLLMSDDCK
ncbi:hypothetical protein SLEP1_g4244 [Rubroshorea leprosula]|uniref:Tetratricopeptide repeat protein 5 OB fold domain-containing protein n=1 Tax=Rubroshorea leprosula TaxID=152421 RepID=A0AAV5HNK3_9ROSI|nr:hypothetical protein SLEP1_g4244 [Rubroshorea leprosula]